GPPRQKLAVLPLRPGPYVDQKTADLITETLVTGLQTRPGIQILSMREIEVALGFEKQRQLLGCANDQSCLVEIGGSLGVDRVVSGSLGKLGHSLVFNVQLINIRSGVVERRFSNRIKGDSEEGFLDAVEAA